MSVLRPGPEYLAALDRIKGRARHFEPREEEWPAFCKKLHSIQQVSRHTVAVILVSKLTDHLHIIYITGSGTWPKSD